MFTNEVGLATLTFQSGEKPLQFSPKQHNTDFCVRASCLWPNHHPTQLCCFINIHSLSPVVSAKHIVSLHLRVWKVAAVFLEVEGHPSSAHKQLDCCFDLRMLLQRFHFCLGDGCKVEPEASGDVSLFPLQESYVWKMYQERCWDFFPTGDCFRKQYEDQLG